MKKMKKLFVNYYVVFSLFFIILIMSSCVKDTTNTTYEGPDLVEFANPNYIAPVNPLTRSITTTVTPKIDSMYIQLVGKQRTTPTAVNFVVDPLSTAILGTDFTITTPSPVTIPANESGVKVRVILNKVLSQKSILINITGGDGVKPSVNYSTFTFTLK
jgi:hypothetical protein